MTTPILQWTSQAGVAADIAIPPTEMPTGGWIVYYRRFGRWTICTRPRRWGEISIPRNSERKPAPAGSAGAGPIRG